MKNCRKIHPLLALYRDQGLTPAQERQVEAHIKTCPQASRELEAFDRLRETMASLPEPQPPRDPHERIMARLHAGSPAQPAPLFRWKFPAFGLAAAACLTLFFLIQYPDVMNPREKKAYVPSGEASNGTAPANQPLAKLPQRRQKKVAAERRAFAQAESADAYAKEMPPPANSPLSVNNTYLAMAKPDLSRKKDFKSYIPETVLTQISPSSGNYAASPPQTLAQSPSNLDYSAGADYKSSELEKKREEVPAAAGSGMGGQVKKQEDASASTAAAEPMAAAPQPAVAVPMAAAPQPAAPEAKAVAAISPATNANIVSAPSTLLPIFWSGIQENPFPEQQKLVTDLGTFKSYWENFHPERDLPAVDFTNQSVVVLMDKVRPNSGFNIHISSLEETTDQLIIHYKTENPPSDSFTAQVLAWPWSMQEISKPAKPVIFQRDP